MIVFLLTLGLLGSGYAEERWEPLELPSTIANARVTGLGALQFPDGATNAWVGTDQGLYRRTADGWQPWPEDMQAESLSGVTAIEVGPGPDGQTSWWLGSHDGLWLFSVDSGLRRLTADDSPLIEQSINVLRFDQARGLGADLWIGGDGGLVLWQQGRWTPVSARPDGFPGGQVTQIRRLTIDGQRERWVIGSEGLGRYVAGQWSRPALDCLRGRQPSSAETIELVDDLHMVVGTRRGLFLLDFQEVPDCQPVEITGHPELDIAVRALTRDAVGRLYLFHDSGVERWHLDRSRVGGWTRFNGRDGLDAGIEWTGPTHRDEDGAVWAGSTAGVWQLRPKAAPANRPPSFVVELNGDGLAPGANPIGLFTRTARIVIAGEESPRSHATRFALTVGDEVDDRTSVWQSGRLERRISLAANETSLSVDVVDAFGLVHGPFEYRLVRSSPLPWILLLVGLGLTAIVMAWLLRRHRR
ncbi:MAG: hypothetical protein ACXIUL_05045 [Wenzhouxiangella sp.]